MNAAPDADPIRELRKHWSVALEDEPVPSAPSVKPRSRIDYIFYQAHGAMRLTHHEVIDEAMASDHRPVLAVFELAPR